jgi:hypothetical protein
VEWRRLVRLLDRYETASGQKLNKEKTSIFFSKNTSPTKRQEIIQLSGFQVSQQYDKYLGLPSLVGKSRTKAFKGIKDRVWNRLNNWKVKFLSQAGKEILLKAVVQAIPTYSMSVFQLPITLCREINGMMQKFWWGHMEKDSKIHWMSWDRMSFSKAQGGMGFRDLVCFNKALLAKQCWRLWQNPDSLAATIIKAKYYPHSTFLEATLGKRPSFAWKSLLSASGLLKSGLVWRVGDGKDIKIWGDRWLPTPTSFSVQSPRRVFSEDARVADLIDQDTKWWNSTLLSSVSLRRKPKLFVRFL